MKFRVIQKEQTPETPAIGDVKEFIQSHLEELRAFLEFAKTETNAVGLAANQTALDNKRFAPIPFSTEWPFCCVSVLVLNLLNYL